MSPPQPWSDSAAPNRSLLVHRHEDPLSVLDGHREAVRRAGELGDLRQHDVAVDYPADGDVSVLAVQRVDPDRQQHAVTLLVVRAQVLVVARVRLMFIKAQVW